MNNRIMYIYEFIAVNVILIVFCCIIFTENFLDDFALNRIRSLHDPYHDARITNFLLHELVVRWLPISLIIVNIFILKKLYDNKMILLTYMLMAFLMLALALFLSGIITYS